MSPPIRDILMSRTPCIDELEPPLPVVNSPRTLEFRIGTIRPFSCDSPDWPCAASVSKIRHIPGLLPAQAEHHILK